MELEGVDPREVYTDAELDYTGVNHIRDFSHLPTEPKAHVPPPLVAGPARSMLTAVPTVIPPRPVSAAGKVSDQ